MKAHGKLGELHTPKGISNSRRSSAASSSRLPTGRCRLNHRVGHAKSGTHAEVIINDNSSEDPERNLDLRVLLEFCVSQCTRLTL
jgi:hypothetical protein